MQIESCSAFVMTLQPIKNNWGKKNNTKVTKYEYPPSTQAYAGAGMPLRKELIEEAACHYVLDCMTM